MFDPSAKHGAIKFPPGSQMDRITEVGKPHGNPDDACTKVLQLVQAALARRGKSMTLEECKAYRVKHFPRFDKRRALQMQTAAFIDESVDIIEKILEVYAASQVAASSGGASAPPLPASMIAAMAAPPPMTPQTTAPSMYAPGAPMAPMGYNPYSPPTPIHMAPLGGFYNPYMTPPPMAPPVYAPGAPMASLGLSREQWAFFQGGQAALCLSNLFNGAATTS